VVGNLLQSDKREPYILKIREEYEAFKVKFLSRSTSKEYVPIATARSQKLQLDWGSFIPVKPKKLGFHTLEVSLETLVPYIDWSPFFRSWDLHGKYPQILSDPVVGTQAQSLFDDAQEMLKKITEEKWLKAKGRYGLFPVNADGDDIETYSDETRQNLSARWVTLRQQLKKTAGQPYRALADYIAPKEQGYADYMGAFCVTTGFGVEERAKAFEKENDDYNSILLKALADRLAEAFAEYLHFKIRTDFWGYAPEETLSNEELIKENYKGIRPAPGYPACPDHLEKNTIWDLLQVEQTLGVTLTESMAMWPASSVSGYYFAHPEARYFGLGKIKRDQLASYATRRKCTISEAEKWLRPNLAEE